MALAIQGAIRHRQLPHRDLDPAIHRRAAGQGIVSVLGSYAASDEHWGWRTVLRLKGPDTLVIESWDIPARQEESAIDTRLPRRAGG